MILLDTTVLVYAAGAEHAYRDPCAALLTAVEAGRIHATTTVEVIQEFGHVHGRRRPRAVVAALARAYVDLLRPLLVVDEFVLREGLGLFEGHGRVGAFDAVLAAAALSQAATLVSVDRAFSTVAGLHQVVPNHVGVAELLR